MPSKVLLLLQSSFFCCRSIAGAEFLERSFFRVAEDARIARTQAQAVVEEGLEGLRLDALQRVPGGRQAEQLDELGDENVAEGRLDRIGKLQDEMAAQGLVDRSAGPGDEHVKDGNHVSELRKVEHSVQKQLLGLYDLKGIEVRELSRIRVGK